MRLTNADHAAIAADIAKRVIEALPDLSATDRFRIKKMIALCAAAVLREWREQNSP